MKAGRRRRLSTGSPPAEGLYLTENVRPGGGPVDAGHRVVAMHEERAVVGTCANLVAEAIGDAGADIRREIRRATAIVESGRPHHLIVHHGISREGADDG